MLISVFYLFFKILNVLLPFCSVQTQLHHWQKTTGKFSLSKYWSGLPYYNLVITSLYHKISLSSFSSFEVNYKLPVVVREHVALRRYQNVIFAMAHCTAYLPLWVSHCLTSCCECKPHMWICILLNREHPIKDFSFDHHCSSSLFVSLCCLYRATQYHPLVFISVFEKICTLLCNSNSI